MEKEREIELLRQIDEAYQYDTDKFIIIDNEPYIYDWVISDWLKIEPTFLKGVLVALKYETCLDAINRNTCDYDAFRLEIVTTEKGFAVREDGLDILFDVLRDSDAVMVKKEDGLIIVFTEINSNIDILKRRLRRDSIDYPLSDISWNCYFRENLEAFEEELRERKELE